MATMAKVSTTEPAVMASALARAVTTPKHRPACDVVDHSGGEDRLTELPTHEVEVHQDLGQHRDRRDGKGGGHEEGENRSIRWVDEKTVRQCKSQSQTRDEGNHETAHRDSESYTEATPNQGQIRLEPGDDEEQHHSDQGHDLEHVTLGLGLGQDPLADPRHQSREDRRAQDHPGQDLADHRRLTHPLCQTAEEAGSGEQHRDLYHELQHLTVGGGAERLQSRCLFFFLCRLGS